MSGDRTVKPTRRGQWFGIALLTAACAPAQSSAAAFPLELRATTDAQAAVAGVRIWADGAELGATSTTGRLRVELRGHAGQAVTLTSACPPGYRTPDPQRRVLLQRLGGAAPATSATLSLRIACEPTERTAIVVVRARANAPLAGMPIRRDGAVIGQTDPAGTAHLLLKVRPASSLRIALDTTPWPELLPRDPVQSYEIGDADSLLLFDQRFAPRAPPARRVPRPSVRSPAPAARAERIPYRIR